MSKEKTLRIVGVDPGTDRVGVAIIEIRLGKPFYVWSAILPFKKGGSLGVVLLSLEKAFKKILEKYNPTKAGVESLFFGNNKTTASAVSAARGVILKTLAEFKIEYYDLSPTHVKKMIGGSGGASKQTVARMVSFLLKKETKKMVDDESDALAIALAAWLHNAR